MISTGVRFILNFPLASRSLESGEANRLAGVPVNDEVAHCDRRRPAFAARSSDSAGEALETLCEARAFKD